MNMTPAKVEALPILEALKPHVGAKGQGLIDAILSLTKLVSSQNVQDALMQFYTVEPVIKKKQNSISIKTESGKLEFDLLTFIVLVVLVLALTTDFSLESIFEVFNKKG